MGTGGTSRVSFVGAGQMATALATGLQGTFTEADCICASDPSAEARAKFESSTGCRAFESNAAVVADADVVVLAVKPHFVEAAAAAIVDGLAADALVVSIAAGIRISELSAMLGGARRLIRVMPNTPCLVGAGASAMAAGEHATAADTELVERMMRTVGDLVVVPESFMDAVTGLSGSGPAYVFQLIEALGDGGVRAGLPRAVASRLAAQTVLGAAQLAIETGTHPAALKDAVASPGGTTIAGLHELERGGLRGTVMNAVVAAAERSRELGAG